MPAKPITTVSTRALERELRARSRARAPLEARRARLAAAIAKIDSRLAKRGEPETWRDDKAAVKALSAALAGGSLSGDEVAAAIAGARALLRELRYLARGPAAWRARRARLAGVLARLDAKLAVAQAPAVPFRRNDMTLLEAASLVLKGKQMTALEVAKAVEGLGYRSLSDRPERVVTFALCSHPELFARVRRGVYTAR